MELYKKMATTLLLGLAVAFQLGNTFLSFPTGFGMVVDLAAFPIMMALLLFGYEYALSALIGLGIVILFTSPTGFVGATMKVAATLSVIVAIYLTTHPNVIRNFILATLGLLVFFYTSTFLSQIHPFLSLFPLLLLFLLTPHMKGKPQLSKKTFLLSLVLGIILRGVVMTIANLYFAGPIFFHMSSEEFLTFLSTIELPLLGKGWPYFVIFFWNAIQTIVEYSLAYALVYPGGFGGRYGG